MRGVRRWAHVGGVGSGAARRLTEARSWQENQRVNVAAQRRFGDFFSTGREWITVMEGEYYPDFLDAARQLYGPVLERFAQLAAAASASEGLLRAIMSEPAQLRVQLLRVFRRYVSPDTSVEMLKRKLKAEEAIAGFGSRFRAIEKVRELIRERSVSDDALFILLYEYRSRGQKGYMLTEVFFAWVKKTFGERLGVEGPPGAGADILLNKVLPGYPVATPADFMITMPDRTPLVVGFARYDSDRGGAQEDDRIRGNNDSAAAILRYAEERGLTLRVLFLNDGPGLLLGSMWQDYAGLEDRWGGEVMVCTLKMLDERLTYEWISGAHQSEASAL